MSPHLPANSSNVGQVRADLRGRQPLRSQRDHHLVDADQTTLPLLDDLRIERSLPDFDLDRPLLARVVPRVARVVALDRMLRIPEMLLKLDLECRLQHGLRQARQQPARPDQLHTLRPRPLDQVVRERLIDAYLRSLSARRRRSHIRHQSSFPPTPTPASQDTAWV